MEFYVLASGSQGNCTVIKTKEALLIIDCGMSMTYLKEAFNKYQLDYRRADALLLTHTHSDHIAQVKNFEKLDKYTTFNFPDAKTVKFYEYFTVKDLQILPLPLSHDVKDTTGYLIKSPQDSLVFITDTGYLNKKNLSYLINADYYIMESNHDPEMLLNTKRPNLLKRRILRPDGHLSNNDCAYYLAELIGENTKEIVLAHLSLEANNPQTAKTELKTVLENQQVNYDKIKIVTAAQDKSYQGGKL